MIYWELLRANFFRIQDRHLSRSKDYAKMKERAEIGWMGDIKAELQPFDDSAQGQSLEELVLFWLVTLWLISLIKKWETWKTFGSGSGSPLECIEKQRILRDKLPELNWAPTGRGSSFVLALVTCGVDPDMSRVLWLQSFFWKQLLTICHSFVKAQPVWKCGVSAAVAVGPFLFSSRWVCLFLSFHLHPGFLLSGTFRFVKPSMPVMLEPSPGTLTNFSLC